MYLTTSITSPPSQPWPYLRSRGEQTCVFGGCALGWVGGVQQRCVGVGGAHRQYAWLPPDKQLAGGGPQEPYATCGEILAAPLARDPGRADALVAGPKPPPHPWKAPQLSTTWRASMTSGPSPPFAILSRSCGGACACMRVGGGGRAQGWAGRCMHGVSSHGSKRARGAGARGPHPAGHVGAARGCQVAACWVRLGGRGWGGGQHPPVSWRWCRATSSCRSTEGCAGSKRGPARGRGPCQQHATLQ